MADDDFKREDAPYLDSVSRLYQGLFNKYGKMRSIKSTDELINEPKMEERNHFLGQNNKKAMLTLEALAGAHAGYLKSGKTNLDFKEYLMELFTEGDVSTIKDNGNILEGGDGYAVTTEYGTMYSYILDSALNFSQNGKDQLNNIFSERLYKSGSGRNNKPGSGRVHVDPADVLGRNYDSARLVKPSAL